MIKLISKLESLIPNPNKGLPIEIFYFVGRLTPYINVDLLVKDIKGRIFFSWRDDEYSGIGWHLPGGIIRYKEKIEERIVQVAKNEIGIDLQNFYGPIDINQIIDYNSKERGHFISLLYICTVDLDNSIYMDKLVKNNPDNYLLSFTSPEKLLNKHFIYKKYF
jgi:ADP-ribose pyrophosphatase YjhB (NUDIX family)